MVYHPQKHPKEAMISVLLIVLVSVLGGIFYHKLFLVAGLVYWMQYTLILSYIQFKSKHKHKWNSMTETLLHPQVRFFVFQFLAIAGLYGVVIFDSIYIGSAVMLAWLAFSFNYYLYYHKFKRYDR